MPDQRPSAKRSWAEIELDAIARNARKIRARNPGRKLIAVVKADAYGHGAVPVARTLLAEGAAMIGVGDSREAIEIRRSGITGPVLILGAIVDGEMPAVVAHDIRTTLHSRSRALLLEDEARRQGKRSRVHLKIDIGKARSAPYIKQVPSGVAALGDLQAKGFGYIKIG